VGSHSDGVSDAVISAVRRVARTAGPDALVIDDLCREDLARLGWSGNPEHLRKVTGALERVALGEVEYLVVRAPGGEPVAKGGIDYTQHEAAGTLWQLATHAQLQSLGLGTCLIAEAERRIRRRGPPWAMLSVEDDNPRARALYERLGYAAWRQESAAWHYEDDEGTLRLYETRVTVLRKRL
jgi:ribosomal protein S18 acetylase RimI-like enzyme